MNNKDFTVLYHLLYQLVFTRPKVTVRKPRVKSVYTLPTNLVKKKFSHYAGMRVSPEAVDEVMKM